MLIGRDLRTRGRTAEAPTFAACQARPDSGLHDHLCTWIPFFLDCDSMAFLAPDLEA